jgi:hypothetical protein
MCYGCVASNLIHQGARRVYRESLTLANVQNLIDDLLYTISTPLPRYRRMYRRDAFLFIINFCIPQLGMMQHAQPRAHIPLDIPPFPRRSALVHWLVLCSLAEP